MVSQESQKLYLPTEILFMMKFKNETYILPVSKLLIIQNILIHIYKHFYTKHRNFYNQTVFNYKQFLHLKHPNRNIQNKLLNASSLSVLICKMAEWLLLISIKDGETFINAEYLTNQT